MSSYSSKRRRILRHREQLLLSLQPALPPPETNSSSFIPDYVHLSENPVVATANHAVSQKGIVISTLAIIGSCNDDIDSNQTELSESLELQLSNWAVKNNITHNAISDLLKIVDPFVTDTLPLSAKSLLKTPRNLTMTNLEGGKFFFFGIEKFLIDIIKNVELNDFYFPFIDCDKRNLVTLTLSTDGIPICKSSNTTLWPILIRIDQAMNYGPFPCAIFCGNGKPASIISFMSDVVKELLLLTASGVEVNGEHYTIKISCFVADRPARSFVKCIKGHGAYHSCERCDDEGDYKFNRVVYSKHPCVSRTNETFRNKLDCDHHLPNIDSPLLQLEFDMVSQFSLDYMHLVLLGVMKKMLCMWTSGLLKFRLSQRDVRKISFNLVECSKYFPSEFPRKPRGLKDLCRFKATEFRHFLLYTGPCVLRDVLDKQKYNHFLLLHCAMKILLSKSANDPILNSAAKCMLKKFVNDGSRIYGEQFVIFNVHSLLHLADDGLVFGNLEFASAFQFENYLQKLKRLVRGKRLQLEQVVRRVLEIKFCPLLAPTNKNPTMTKKKAIYSNFFLSPKRGNNCFVDKYGRILILKEINQINCTLHCEILVSDAVSWYPINSKHVSAVKIEIRKKMNVVNLKLSDVVDKCILLPLKINNGKFLCYRMNLY